MTEVVRYKNDGGKRKRLFVAGAMAHPAKGHISLWEEMVLRYSKEGDLVLDPMAGIGTSLIAALMGRNVVCVELEQHFVEPMRRSWEKMRQQPMLGYEMGEVEIYQGDARDLSRLWPVDAIITSPPYEGSVAEGPSGIDWTKQADGRKKQEPHGVGAHPWGYTRGVDAIVTSPPYEGGGHHEGTFDTWGGGHAPEGYIGKLSGQSAGAKKEGGYTRPVDAIVTSPPYEGSEVAQSSDGEANRRFRAGEYHGDALKGMGLSKGYTRKPVDAIVDTNVAECYNVSKCLLDITLEQRSNGAYYLRPNEESGHQDGLTNPVSQGPNITNSAWIAAVKLTDGLNDATPAQTDASLLLQEGNPLVRQLNGILEKSIQSIKACWADGTLLKPEIKCPLHYSKVESLQSLVNAVSWELQSGRTGELRSLNEITIPASIAERSPALAKWSISIPIMSSKLLSTLSLLLKSAMDSHCASLVTTKSTGVSLGVNIGNLRANAYWSEIAKVYQECFRVLKPGGIMALVLKGFTRDGKYVDLPSQTLALCSSLGFVPFDSWRRELWSLSFWRTLQKRRDPAAFDDRLNYEEVIAFRRVA